ncbi:hypothetical protein Tco_1334842 [Tanacetum coccineum]
MRNLLDRFANVAVIASTLVQQSLHSVSASQSEKKRLLCMKLNTFLSLFTHQTSFPCDNVESLNTFWVLHSLHNDQSLMQFKTLYPKLSSLTGPPYSYPSPNNIHCLSFPKLVLSDVIFLYLGVVIHILVSCLEEVLEGCFGSEHCLLPEATQNGGVIGLWLSLCFVSLLHEILVMEVKPIDGLVHNDFTRINKLPFGIVSRMSQRAYGLSMASHTFSDLSDMLQQIHIRNSLDCVFVSGTVEKPLYRTKLCCGQR